MNSLSHSSVRLNFATVKDSSGFKSTKIHLSFKTFFQYKTYIFSERKTLLTKIVSNTSV